jgi:hypothetical protein
MCVCVCECGCGCECECGGECECGRKYESERERDRECEYLHTVMLLAYYPTRFALWLKSQKRYTVTQINNYLTVTSSIFIASSLGGATLASVFAP